MRGREKVVVAGLVFALFAAAAGGASAAKDPVTGGMLALPGEAVEPKAVEQCACPPQAQAPGALPIPTAVPAPIVTPLPVPPPAPPPPLPPPPVAAPPEANGQDDTSWGLLARGGYFGLPSFIADELFVQHPNVVGLSYGFEIRYYGDGHRGGNSYGISVDVASARMDGAWQQKDADPIKIASGDVDMLAFTVTRYWDFFPTWYLHPYLGLGIGAAHAKGYYLDESDKITADIWIPVLHIPIGLAIEIGDRFEFVAEGRFLDGIAIGAALQARF